MVADPATDPAARQLTPLAEPTPLADQTPADIYRRRLADVAREALQQWASARSQALRQSNSAELPEHGSERCVIEAANQELALIDHERLVAGLQPLDRSLVERLTRGVLGATLGLGPLHDIFEDRRVEEVLGRWDYVVIHRAGQPPEIRSGAASPWESQRQLIDWLSYAARTRGLTERTFNPASPLLVLRLGPGLRLAAQREVGDRVSFALRRNVLGSVVLDDLVDLTMMPTVIADLLAAAMDSGDTRLVISGATGAGKTTVARACLGHLEPAAHVIVMEDTAEIDLFDPTRHPNVESWEVREPNAEDRGGVDLGDLVRHSLRHRPDWNVVGEVRDGRAAIPMVAAMTAGVASLTTVHATSASGAIDKLQLYLGMGPEAMPASIAQLQLSLAVDLVVHVARHPDTGHRFISEVLQVAGFDGERCQTNLIFRERGGRRIGANVLTDELANRLLAVGFDPRRLSIVESTSSGPSSPAVGPPQSSDGHPAVALRRSTIVNGRSNR